MKRWITFDLDGTLMQNPFGKWVFPEVKQLIEQQLNTTYNSTESLVREHELRMSQNRSVEAYDWDDMLRQLLKELQLELEIDIEQLVIKHSVAPKIYLLEETIIPTLKSLKQQGYSLATVTNGFYKYQFPVMKALGLSECFDEIITPEIAGCGKPNEGIFRALLESGTIVAHVGDRLDHDVFLANHKNVYSILIYHNLPDCLRPLAPHERPRTESFLQISEEKLKKESAYLSSTPFPESYTPSHVIYTLAELPSILR
ncbi:HAD family hydrolase [Paenibacillus cremeus]|nr:HAD family hydrolase [Paenibacillus cremeus]